MPLQKLNVNNAYSVKLTEKRAKQRELDIDCQRHNSEAVIKGMDEKLKEKDKEHRFGLTYNLICIYCSTIKAQYFVERNFV